MEKGIPKRKNLQHYSANSAAPFDVQNSRLVQDMISAPPSKDDPFGSYTGKPIEYGEVPVQDADDL